MIALSITPLKPISIASMMARIALSTEAQPLMPQAHGMSCGSSRRVVARPSGKGMPIANASGAASTIAAAKGNELKNNDPGLTCAALLEENEMQALLKLEAWVAKYNALLYEKLSAGQ